MDTNTIHCSHCNATAVFAYQPNKPVRLRCWQCDELFAYKPDDSSADSPVEIIDTRPPQPIPDAVSRPSNRKVAAMALAGMAAVALIGLAYALLTVDYRDSVTKKKKKGDVAVYWPAELPALQYLPANSGFVIAVQVGQIMQTPAGKKLVADKKTGLGWALQQLENATGFGPSGINHIAVAIDQADLSHLFIVVQMQHDCPPDAVAIETRIDTTEFRGKTAHRLKIPPASEGWVWCIDKRTFALIWQIGWQQLGSLDRFPAKPHPKLEGLAPEVRNLLTERIDKPAKREKRHIGMWCTGKLTPQKWQLPFIKLDKDVPIESLAVSAKFGDRIHMIGSLRGNTKQQTRTLHNIMRGQAIPTLQVFPLPKKIETDEQNWVLWQAWTEPRHLAEMLGKLVMRQRE